MEPPRFPQNQKSGGNYFVGRGLGSIPLILFLIVFGTLMTSPNLLASLVYLIYATLFLYVALFIAAMGCLFIERARFVGYGLLTAFLMTPVIAYIGCLVIINRPH